MRYYLKTFGCQMNYADSEKINMILLQSGFQKARIMEEADIVLLNTCSVRQKGEDRVFGYMREAKDFAKKFDKEILVGVTGCMVRKTGIHERYYASERKRKATKKISLLENEGSIFNSDDKIFGVTDRADFVMRIEEIWYLTKILSVILGSEIGSDDKWNDYLQIKQAQDNPGSANVIIQTGCDNLCTYCIVPFTRGRETSRSMDDIVAEVRGAIAWGAHEVTLLGQNVNSYGKESRAKLWDSEAMKWKGADVLQLSKTPFRELLERVNEIDGLDRIRFTSSNPHDMTPDILAAHFELPRMCHYLHFALQSGSDEILRRMNRRHTYADFKLQLDYLRSRDPLFSISTDIIVGFPGETEEQFEETVRAFKECVFDFAYIARYSPRRGTVAGDRLTDDVPMKEKARRWDILNTLLYESVRARSELMIGRAEEILISSAAKDETLVGRTRNFKEVFIRASPDIHIGDIVPVKIVGMDRWVLQGERM